MGNLNAKAMNITKLDCFQLMSPSLPLVYLTMEHCTVRNLLQETLQTTSFQKFKKKKKRFFFSWPYYVASGTLVLWPGLNPHPLRWESIVFTTGPPGKSWKPLLTCLISYNTFSIHCTNLFLCVCILFAFISTFLEIRKWKWSHSVVSDSLRPHRL